MRILVIDDDKVFTEPLLWHLEQEGFEVTLCKSVDNILDRDRKLKVGRPDCIILDVMMPYGERYSKDETNSGKDTGLKLLEDIYKEEPGIPVVIVTVRNDLSLIKLQEKFGDTIKAILVKPVTPSKVVDTLKKLVPGTV